MSVVDRLSVIYEVNDAQAQAGMARIAATSRKTNAELVAGAQKVENATKAMRGQIQNFAFQAQDVAVQIAAGTSAATAFGQQLPQLLGGFGALGAVLGAIVAIGVPVAASFFSMEEEAADLSKQVNALQNALEALREAQANAAMPIDLLIEKYGALGDEMARVFQNQLAIARQELENMGKAIESALASTANLDGMVTRFDALKQAVDAGVISYDEYRAQLRDLESTFGMTIAQALQYQELMNDIASAEGPEAQAQAWLAVHDWIEANRAALADQGVAVDDLIKQTNKLAGSYGDAHAAASDVAAAADAGAVATDNWAAAAANLSANMDGAAAAAGRAAAAIGAAIAAQNQQAGLNFGAIDPFSESSGRVLTSLAGGGSVLQQADEEAAWRKAVEAQDEALKKAEREAARKAGARPKKAGGSAKKGKAAPDLFESADREITQLQRQIELLGKTSQEVATLQSKWAMLDAAKKAGVPINDQLNGQIEAQAQQVGQLTADLENAKTAQDDFNQAMESIANAFTDAILGGENLRDSLANIFKQIAANILNAGIQNALSQAFSGAGGGGGGFLGAIGSAIVGGLSGKRASGGSVRAGGAYLVNENTPNSEVFVPSVNGAILNVAQAQAALRGQAGGGNGQLQMSASQLTISDDGRIMATVTARIAQASRSTLSQVPNVVAEHNRRRG